MADNETVAQVPVVLRFRDGHVVHAVLDAGGAPPDSIVATDDGGGAIQVPLTSLKGVFYPKPARERLLSFETPPAIGKAQTVVEFEDGEVLSGCVETFDVRKPGFFIYPTNPQDNNQRIYVVTAAVRSVELRP